MHALWSWHVMAWWSLPHADSMHSNATLKKHAMQLGELLPNCASGAAQAGSHPHHPVSHISTFGDAGPNHVYKTSQVDSCIACCGHDALGVVAAELITK
jgi:hypothetical protein